MRDLQFKNAQSGAAISVKVSPNAGRDEVVGAMSDGAIKIQLKAKPVDGAANEALIDLLAERLDVPRSQIEIIGGRTSSRKLISILGISPAEVEARLLPPEREKRRQPAKKKSG
jgi:uncharacterized protein (TIGR00251 family)